MKKIYKEYNFTLAQPRQHTEMLIALLAHAGFEGFVETPNGFLAYTDKIVTPQTILADLDIPYKISVQNIPEKNWNETWEKQIKPLVIEDQIYIRTSFHPHEDYPVVITIDPKMSFGTGHHETTYLMIKQLLKLDLSEKTVIDMGSGTGVLAVLVKKYGANTVFAIDNDPWAYENMLENFQTNRTPDIKAFLGDAKILKDLPFVDLFMANINRNILCNDMATYAQHLKPGGILIISGFYEADIPLLLSEAQKNGMIFEFKEVKNNWASLKLIKN